MLVSSAYAQSLPAGDGKTLVQMACTRCHSPEKFTVERHTREDWAEEVDVMLRYGAPLTSAQAVQVVDYLTKSFPGRPKPHGVAVSGPVEATIDEWTVLTPGARPHDPAVAPDGAVWYTGQANGTLGRLDPATGAKKEYPLRKLETSKFLPYGVGPHGLTADRDGNIWYTAQLAGFVGKLDPATGAQTQYRMPDPAARDPHTPIFDEHGTLWFTLQMSDMVGRILPSTGDVKVVRVPTASSQPYGIKIDSTGKPWFVELTAGRVGTIDPATLAIREYPLPNAGSMPRRLAITDDDVIWYTDYGRGYLGRLDPKTGKATEFATPSGAGADSQPYAITTVGGIVWYVESGVTPNMVVRFDPATRQFQSWPIPSGGGVVRHMVTGPDGSLWLAESGVDRIARLQVRAGPASSSAQGLSLDEVTLAPAAARRALVKAEINGATAEKLVNACLDYAKAHNGGASVVVLSPSGFIVHAQRSDGQQPNNIDSAMHKAQTALYLRASTREGLNRWNNLEAQLVRSDMSLYLNPGGFPIIVADQVIGAIGVGGASGGDEQCGYEALTRVLGPQPPMAPARPFGGVGNEPPAASAR
jgi:virginiamycin B lyase